MRSKKTLVTAVTVGALIVLATALPAEASATVLSSCQVHGTVSVPPGSSTGSGSYQATCAEQTNPPLGPVSTGQLSITDSPTVDTLQTNPPLVCGVVGSITSGPGNPTLTNPPWGSFRIDFAGSQGVWTWTDPSITGKGVVNINTNQLQTAPSCPTQYTFDGIVTASE